MRKIDSPPAFDRRLVKFIKKNPDLKEKIEKVFKLLERDVKHPLLHSHRLSGRLARYFACSITYSYRLIFRFDQDYIYLRAIGSHDEVY